MKSTQRQRSPLYGYPEVQTKLCGGFAVVSSTGAIR